jgi:hypothetical protein
MTIVAVWLLDRVGRRLLIYTGSFAIGLARCSERDLVHV